MMVVFCLVCGAVKRVDCEDRGKLLNITTMVKKLSRRAFMMMTGSSGAAFMFGPGEKFLHKLIAYVNPPEYPKPGEWAFYTTTCRECPAGCGMILWHRDGRITKAEGNPLHPVNAGKLCIRGQSSVQGVYNMDRLSEVLHRQNGNFIKSDWQTAISKIQADLAGGKKPLVLSDLQTGSLAGTMNTFTAKYGSAAPHFYEVFNYESMRSANMEMYGQPVIPRYNLKGCDLIVSYGADFLETWLSPVEYAREFGVFHSMLENLIGKLVYVGPAETLTSLNADLFAKVNPGNDAAVLYSIIHLLGTKGKIQIGPDIPLPPFDPLNPNNDHAEKIATLIINAKSPIILAGRPEDATNAGKETVKAVNLLNELLGNRSRIDFSQTHALSGSAMRAETVRFLESINRSHILFIHKTNPIYSLKESAKYLKNAGGIVYMGTEMNETSAYADWVLPVHYPFEEWGDYEPWKGTISLIQPGMRPIFDTRSAGDIFLEVAGENSQTYKDIVRNNWLNWSGMNAASVEPSGFYRQVLQKGSLVYTPSENNPVLRNTQFPVRTVQNLAAGAFFLDTKASLFFYDGRLANRPWIQEIPHPVSNMVWQSWLDMSAFKAKDLGIEDGDQLRVSTPTGQIELPVRLTNNIARDSVSVETGQGHRNFGRTATGVGANAFELVSFFNSQDVPVAKVDRIGKGENLYLNFSKDQHHRDLLKEVKFKAIHEESQEEITWPGPEGYDPERDLYKPHAHKEHRWGMVIDLQKCIGCKACEAACYAENNIPVVGRESCKGGKEMSWLKVPPYYLKNGKTAFIPLPCQHCDAAPCEPVCPVFASVHTEEGLNAQIYNRCVGTRYCSNNCPYKVRRFNWKNIKYEYPWTLQLNPEVTVRERGVMEKCTFCVQRIRNTEQQAKVAGRKIHDGEIMTACQQTCPTGAIVFGDLNDSGSEVRKMMNDKRRYQLLHELNTKPAVVYLKKIVVEV